MQRMYAIAELTWPKELTDLPCQGRLTTPAFFQDDTRSAWSLIVWLENPAQAGATITAPVTPLMGSDAPEELLRVGSQFDLFLGATARAKGRVLSAHTISVSDLKCLFHFC